MTAKTACGCTATNLDVVLEEEAVATHRVITYKTVGSAELQPGKNRIILEEAFVAGYPTDGS